jgi:Family of unknown function (DUF6527)
MTLTQLIPRFVETIPEALEPGVLYVSMSLSNAIHLCACGCGQEVITPLSPTDWKLYFDGENVSLDPSIGNWSFPCRSHYWIRGGKVRWAGSMSAKEIEVGRLDDRQRKSVHYESQNIEHEGHSNDAASPTSRRKPWRSRLPNLWSRLRGRGSSTKES